MSVECERPSDALSYGAMKDKVQRSQLTEGYNEQQDGLSSAKSVVTLSTVTFSNKQRIILSPMLQIKTA